jgi:hypothetical protein
MNDPIEILSKFFGVVLRGQTYLNLVYLLLAFPLGIFYFILLVTGFTLGLGLLIIWIGVFVLAGMFAAWWVCAVFERWLAIGLLHEAIPPMSRGPADKPGAWEQIKAHLANPVTWKSLLFLLAKFPLGIFSFILLVTLLGIVLVFMAAPVFMPFFPVQVMLWGDMVWVADTLQESILAFFIGVALLFPSLHVLNALAWVSGRFAHVMLGNFRPTVEPTTSQPAAPPPTAQG